MLPPVPIAGAVKVSVAVVAPVAEAESAVGAAARDTALVDDVLAADEPVVLFAVSAKVYAVLAVRPVMASGDAVDTVVAPAGLLVSV